jgi:small-conductance mechanosensitive channel
VKETIIRLLDPIPYSSYLQNDYVFAVFILLLSAAAAKLLLFVFSRYLQKLAKKTKTRVDDLIFERTKKPLFYFILVYGLKIALDSLDWNSMIAHVVDSALAIVFLFILLRVFDVIIGTWGEAFAKKTKTKADEVLLPLFHKIAKVIFFIVGFIWILDIWKIDVTPYLAGVGISGIVLGLALQDILKNVFGGVTLLLDKTYQIGDKVQLESGTTGTIHDIGLRSTKMVTFDNEIIYIPNGYLANSRVQNYTRPDPQVRTGVVFGVEYGSDVEKVRNLVLKTVSKIDGVLQEPAPAVQFVEMGDSALQFKANFWVEKWNEAYGKKLEATEAIYNALNKAGVSIPFPTRTVYMKHEK